MCAQFLRKVTINFLRKISIRSKNSLWPSQTGEHGLWAYCQLLRKASWPVRSAISAQQSHGILDAEKTQQPLLWHKTTFT